uniref:Uncharacterized protein n=1 Tax=Trichuris muris TaxID=70415 RepID=A0A5S6QB91_TRIMR
MKQSEKTSLRLTEGGYRQGDTIPLITTALYINGKRRRVTFLVANKPARSVDQIRAFGICRFASETAVGRSNEPPNGSNEEPFQEFGVSTNDLPGEHTSEPTSTSGMEVRHLKSTVRAASNLLRSLEQKVNKSPRSNVWQV